MRSFWKMFVGQTTMMALVTWGFRMIAAGNIPMVLLSETIWALSNFWYMKHVIRDETTGGWLGYSLGCVIGTTGSVWLTKVL